MADNRLSYEQFYTNRLLFGDLRDTGIVAAEIATPTEVEFFRRTADSLVRERRPLQLFILASERNLLKGTDLAHTIEELEGDFYFRWLYRFQNLDALDAAKRHLREITDKAPGSPDARYFVLADPIEQHLLLTGSSFFMGLSLGNLRRMQIAVEACITPGFERPNGEREGDRIAALALSDSTGFECVLSGAEFDEKQILRELVRIIGERDPDVIEGHELFRFGLEYLEARARRLRIQPRFGRDNSTIRGRSARMQIAERAIAYKRYSIYGRSLIDTWILAQHYDISSREVEGFALADLARHFNLDGSKRARLSPVEIGQYLERDPQTLGRHVLENANETAALANLLVPSYFVQAQIFPYAYQDVVLRGNATKIDSLMIRAYLNRRHSIPKPAEPTEVLGGYTEIRRRGVARDVLHCDVTSLYPSLMVEHSLGPTTDCLGVFLRMLTDLRSFRIHAKQSARDLGSEERRNLEALQQTFKILINSFYGYLGFSLGHFNDFVQAGEITRRGRDLIRAAIAELEARAAQVIEVDTDGIYFVAPAVYDDEQGQEKLLAELAAAIPGGVKLEIDGRYPAMFSYKMKNYVLLDEVGELTIKGSGLKSRGLERFQRRFMEEMFRLLMTDRRADIPRLFADYQQRIGTHAIGIEDLMKTETLQDSLDNYHQKVATKRRNAAAAYELALKASRSYVSGDRISYYVTGKGPKVKVNTAAKMAADYDPAYPDENVEYYQAKLRDLYLKFKPYVDRPGLFDCSELEDTGNPIQKTIFSKSQ